jgi:hypothetical protein
MLCVVKVHFLNPYVENDGSKIEVSVKSDSYPVLSSFFGSSVTNYSNCAFLTRLVVPHTRRDRRRGKRAAR